MLSQTISPQAVETVSRYRPIAELIPAHWTDDVVTANGIRQHFYRTGGAKPPLLLLHGFMDSALTWLRTARALENEYDILMLDTRGHGHSESIASGYAPELLTLDTAAFLRALGLEKVRLIGHSQGGATGIFLTAQYPELVQALVVEGWFDEVRGDMSNAPGYQQWLDSYSAWLRALKGQTHTEQMVAGLDQLMPGAPIPRQEDYVAWIASCANLDLDLLGQGANMRANGEQNMQNMRTALKQITQPVLILKSDGFPKPGAPIVTEQASGQDNIRKLYFENAGHVIHHEQLDEYLDVVKSFFAGKE